MCLTCSAKADRLVQRSALALDREAEQRRARQECRQAAKRQREQRKREERAVRERAAEAERQVWEDGQRRIAAEVRRCVGFAPAMPPTGVEPWRTAAGLVMADLGYGPHHFAAKHLRLRTLEDWALIARSVAVWDARKNHRSWKAWRRDVHGWEHALAQYRRLGLDAHDDRLPILAAERVDRILRDALGRGETFAEIRKHAAAWITPQLGAQMSGPSWAMLTRPPRRRSNP